MSTVALIPARGGSRGLPGKNLERIGRHSLVALAIQCAKTASGIDEVVVSSDDPAILGEGEKHGADTMQRPDHLATDDAVMIDVVHHFLEKRPDTSTLVLLQPTSPLRQPEDIERCLAALDGAPSAATVAPVEHPIEWLFRLGDDDQLVPVFGWGQLRPRRQDARDAYLLNGAVFAARSAHLRSGEWFTGPDTVGIVMPRLRSIDIDDAIDLALVRVVASTKEL